MEDITKALIPVHSVVSRNVDEHDLGRVRKDSPLMMELCRANTGYNKTGGFAVAHPQITSEDPLRFFVLRDGKVFINPEILDQTKVGKWVYEGCLSIPEKPHVRIQRPHKITVRYQSLTEDGMSLTPFYEAQFKGVAAQIFCHEVDHFDGKYV